MDLYIPKTKELVSLAEYLSITTESLIEKIELGFSKQEYKLDSQEDAGKPLYEILESMEIKVPVFACFYLKRSDKFINETISNLYFKNTLDDCDNCGCETITYFGFEIKNKGTETKVCSNCEEQNTEITNWEKENII